MLYRALMLDVDGTLSPYSNAFYPLPPHAGVLAAVARAKNIVHVGLATSRPRAKVTPLLQQLELNGYSILQNGAHIINSATLETVWTQPVSDAALDRMYALFERHTISAAFGDFHHTNPLTSYDQLRAQPVSSLFLERITAQHLALVETELSFLPDMTLHLLNVMPDGYYELSLTHHLASKQAAIAEVARLLNITTAEIIGVGDGHNDIGLMRACGLKVAMGNAVQPVKEIADVVAPSVDDDGVAWVIETYVEPQHTNPI